MTIIDRSALLPFSAESVFDLVADIEGYPDFLPGCVGAEIIERDAHTDEGQTRRGRSFVRS